jgi:hypothetical protein
MIKDCCNLTLSNTGGASCKSIMEVARKILIFPLFKADGTENTMTLAEVKTLTAWDAKITDAVAKQRVYPSTLLRQVTDLREDATYQDFDDGSRAFVRDGRRSFGAWMVNEGPILLGNMKSFRGGAALGVVILSTTNQFIYNDCCGDDLVRAIPIDQDSWNPQLVKKTNGEAQYLSVEFDFSIEAKDEYLRTVDACELEVGFNPVVQLKGLLDVEFSAASITINGCDLSVFDAYGVAIEGLDLTTGFTFTNVTATGTVALTSAVETSAGVYAVLYTAPVAASDVINPAKDSPVVVSPLDYAKFNKASYATPA